MSTDEKLKQSSPTTRTWLQQLRDDLEEFEYGETKYYAAFRTRSPRAVAAYLNPSKRGIRLFLRLDPGLDTTLQPTPSTSSWAERFPAVFPIKSEQDIPTARGLILRSAESIHATRKNNPESRPTFLAPDELPSNEQYVEGATRRVLVNAYERNRQARERCIEHHGGSCVACGFNFGAKYGDLVAGLIHVHHVVPIAKVGSEYELDPVNDLRPVCPNCHAVMHRREPPFSVEEVKGMLEVGCSDEHFAEQGAASDGHPATRSARG